jgi:hypothetical protein
MKWKRRRTLNRTDVDSVISWSIHFPSFSKVRISLSYSHELFRYSTQKEYVNNEVLTMHEMSCLYNFLSNILMKLGDFEKIPNITSVYIKNAPRETIFMLLLSPYSLSGVRLDCTQICRIYKAHISEATLKIKIGRASCFLLHSHMSHDLYIAIVFHIKASW